VSRSGMYGSYVTAEREPLHQCHDPTLGKGPPFGLLVVLGVLLIEAVKLSAGLGTFSGFLRYDLHRTLHACEPFQLWFQLWYQARNRNRLHRLHFFLQLCPLWLLGRFTWGSIYQPSSSKVSNGEPSFCSKCPSIFPVPMLPC
jgi:hypothetical protein